jgi:hypothetical protein
MSYNAKPLFACPDCRSDLSLDVGQLVAFGLEQPQPFSLTFNGDPEMEFMRYGPDPGAEQPCPHLVHSWVGVTLWEGWGEPRTFRGEIFLMSVDRWFATDSANMEVKSLVNEYAAAEKLPFGHGPTAPHHIADPNHTFRVERGGSKWLLAVDSVFIFAAEPLAFLEELRTIHQRLAETS